MLSMKFGVGSKTYSRFCIRFQTRSADLSTRFKWTNLDEIIGILKRFGYCDWLYLHSEGSVRFSTFWFPTIMILAKFSLA